MKMRIVTITWMDGKQDNYDADTVTAVDGILRLYGDGTVAGRDEIRGFPLENVRSYKVEAK